MQKKILLVEDDELLRMGLKTMVEMHEDYALASDTANGAEAIRLFDQKDPDVVLLDLGLPDLSGIDVLRHMKKTKPSIPVVILTVCNDNKQLYIALENKANAYVLKESGPQELFLGIQYASKGELFISPKLAESIVQDYLLVNRKRSALPPLHALTKREKEIVKLIINGNKSKEIAEILYISVKTVDKHRSNIIGKLGISNLADLKQNGIYALDKLSTEKKNEKI